MNEQEIKGKLEELEKKIDAIYVSTEKTRKYFLTVMYISIAAVVIPFVGLLFAIPAFLSGLSQYSSLLQ